MTGSGSGDVWAELATVRARLRALLEDVDGHRLECAECGLQSFGKARGWTLRPDVSDDELHAFCPDCDQREFGGVNDGA